MSMGKFIITEDEKKRILNLYEQSEIPTDTNPSDDNLLQFLKDNIPPNSLMKKLNIGFKEF